MSKVELRRRIILCLGIVIIMSTVAAVAQLTTGTITGTVTDQVVRPCPAQR
jgi:hypothetical protein